MMEPFVELPEEQWPKLKESLKINWPLNVPAYYTLYLNMAYPNVKDAFQFKIYCPFGDSSSGFVATTFKHEPECIIWPISEDTSKLEEALVKTNVIDWSQKICIDTVSSVVLKLLERIRTRIGFSFFQVGLVKTFFFDKTTGPFKGIRCPPNTYIGAAKYENIHQIDECWPYKHADSLRYFSVLAENGSSFALYSSQYHRLLTWVFLNEYNFLCHLYCVEEYRKRGYSQFLLKFVVNEQLKNGNDVYTYVEGSNNRSDALFRKLGFVAIDDSGYLYVQK